MKSQPREMTRAEILDRILREESRVDIYATVSLDELPLESLMQFAKEIRERRLIVNVDPGQPELRIFGRVIFKEVPHTIIISGGIARPG
jgi:hypothetical protein